MAKTGGGKAIIALAIAVFSASPASAHFPDRCAPQMDAWAVASSAHNERIAETRRLVEAGAGQAALASALKRQTETAYALSIALHDLFLCTEGH